MENLMDDVNAAVVQIGVGPLVLLEAMLCRQGFCEEYERELRVGGHLAEEVESLSEVDAAVAVRVELLGRRLWRCAAQPRCRGRRTCRGRRLRGGRRFRRGRVGLAAARGRRHTSHAPRASPVSTARAQARLHPEQAVARGARRVAVARGARGAELRTGLRFAAMVLVGGVLPAGQALPRAQVRVVNLFVHGGHALEPALRREQCCANGRVRAVRPGAAVGADSFLLLSRSSGLEEERAAQGHKKEHAGPVQEVQ